MLSRMSDERREAMLFDYLADALEPAARAEFEAFLEATPAWRERLERERRLESNLRAMPAAPLPANLAERLKAKGRERIEQALREARMEETAAKMLQANAKRLGRPAKVVSIDDLGREEAPEDSGKSYPGERAPRSRVFATMGWAAAALFALVYVVIVSQPMPEGASKKKIFGGVNSQVASSTQKLVGAAPRDAGMERQTAYANDLGEKKLADEPVGKTYGYKAPATPPLPPSAGSPGGRAPQASPFAEPALDAYGGGGVNNPRLQRLAREQEERRLAGSDLSLPEEWFADADARVERALAMADDEGGEKLTVEDLIGAPVGDLEEADAEPAKPGKESDELGLLFEDALPSGSSASGAAADASGIASTTDASGIASTTDEFDKQADAATRMGRVAGLAKRDRVADAPMEEAPRANAIDQLTAAPAPLEAASVAIAPPDAERPVRYPAPEESTGYALALATFERALAENGLRLLDRETLPDGRVRLLVAGQESQLEASLASPSNLSQQFAAAPAPRRVSEDFAQSGLPTVVWNPRDRYSTMNDANELLALRGDGSEYLPQMQNTMFQAAMTLEEMPLLSVDYEWRPLAGADSPFASGGGEGAFFGMDAKGRSLEPKAKNEGGVAAGPPARRGARDEAQAPEQAPVEVASGGEADAADRVYALTIRPLVSTVPLDAYSIFPELRGASTEPQSATTELEDVETSRSLNMPTRRN